MSPDFLHLQSKCYYMRANARNGIVFAWVLFIRKRSVKTERLRLSKNYRFSSSLSIETTLSIEC